MKYKYLNTRHPAFKITFQEKFALSFSKSTFEDS